MKKVSIVTALLLAFPYPALSDDDRGTIRANLSGFQEVPVVSTTGEGRFRAEAVSPELLNWELTYEAMEGTVTQAHVHIAQRNVNGGIVIWLCQSTTNPAPASAGVVPTCTSPSGSFTGAVTPANVQTVAAQHFGPPDLAEVIAFMRAGLAYANVHTNLSPGGEIRGQTRRGGGHHDRDD